MVRLIIKYFVSIYIFIHYANHVNNQARVNSEVPLRLIIIDKSSKNEWDKYSSHAIRFNQGNHY